MPTLRVIPFYHEDMPASPLYLYFSYNIIVSFYSLETQAASPLTDQLHGQDQESKREHSVQGPVEVMALRGGSPACDALFSENACSCYRLWKPKELSKPITYQKAQGRGGGPVTERGAVLRSGVWDVCQTVRPTSSPLGCRGGPCPTSWSPTQSTSPGPKVSTTSAGFPAERASRPQPALPRSLTTTLQVGNAQILAPDPTILPTHCACPQLAIRTVNLTSHRTPIPVVRVSPGCPPPPPPLIPWVRHPSQSAWVPVPAPQLPVCLPASGSSHRPTTDRRLSSNNTPNPVTVLPVSLSQAQNHSPDRWPRTAWPLLWGSTTSCFIPLRLSSHHEVGRVPSEVGRVSSRH